MKNCKSFFFSLSSLLLFVALGILSDVVGIMEFGFVLAYSNNINSIGSRIQRPMPVTTTRRIQQQQHFFFLASTRKRITTTTTITRREAAARRQKQLDRVTRTINPQPEEATTISAKIGASSSSSSTSTRKSIDIIPSWGQFRETKYGEVSIVSYNVLAPYYHCLLPGKRRNKDRDGDSTRQEEDMKTTRSRQADEEEESAGDDDPAGNVIPETSNTSLRRGAANENDDHEGDDDGEEDEDQEVDNNYDDLCYDDDDDDDDNHDENDTEEVEEEPNQQQHDADDDEVRVSEDRRIRLPQSIRYAKSTNADILCLQEVEGGPIHEPTLRSFLINDETFNNNNNNTNTNTNTTIVVQGYDSYLWSSLYPNRIDNDDVVGLCIAWRSSKYKLISSECYRRGMIVQLVEVATDIAVPSKVSNKKNKNSVVVVANLHLPAKPSAINGRLRTILTTVRKLQELESNVHHILPPSPLSPTPDKRQRQEHDVVSDALMMGKGQQQKQQQRKQCTLLSSSSSSALFVIAGDMNGDGRSAAMRYLQKGYIKYGKIEDRNYKLKMSKSDAANMRHPFKGFQNVYDDHYQHYHYGPHPNNNNVQSSLLRQVAAPVTVSLTGRGPGCMDHILFYCPTSTTSRSRGNVGVSISRASSSSPSSSLSRRNRNNLVDGEIVSKRKARRKRATLAAALMTTIVDPTTMQQQQQRRSHHHHFMTIESVLSTVDPNDDETMKIIHDGLPNLQYDFPSDHMPVGVLLVPATNTNDDDERKQQKELGIEDIDDDNNYEKARRIPRIVNSAISSQAQQRREDYRTSIQIRRRHNAVLRTVADWLISSQGGAKDMIRDEPLHKWKWLQQPPPNDDEQQTTAKQQELKGRIEHNGEEENVNDATTTTSRLRNRMRSPDLACIVGNGRTMIIVEVTVISKTKNPHDARKEKVQKYRDIIEKLRTSPVTIKDGLHVADTIVIVVSEDGHIPIATRDDLRRLARLTAGHLEYPDDDDDEDVMDWADSLGESLSELVQALEAV